MSELERPDGFISPGFRGSQHDVDQDVDLARLAPGHERLPVRFDRVEEIGQNRAIMMVRKGHRVGACAGPASLVELAGWWGSLSQDPPQPVALGSDPAVRASRNVWCCPRTIRALVVPDLWVVTMTRSSAAKTQSDEDPRHDVLFDRELGDPPPELRWREWMLRIEAVIFAAAGPVSRETLARVVGEKLQHRCPDRRSQGRAARPAL
jgi:hypothetical protein